MYNDNQNSDQIPNFEKFPGSTGEASGEQLEKAAEWENTMSNAPEFAGETQFGVANEINEFYGEAVPDEAEAGVEYNEGVADAAALINYGLNAAAQKYGVENIVQKIKGFDTTGSENPIKDFYEYLGVDTAEEKKEIHDISKATASNEAELRDGPNKPSQNKSVFGAFAAIDDMKELIGEVESADPRYEELRQGAKEAGMGVFDFAVSKSGNQNLVQLFQVLAAQREKSEAAEKTEETVESQETEGPAQPEKSDETESSGQATIEKTQDQENQGETLNPEILKR